MSLLERDSVLVSTTENGDPIVDLPFTRVNNVEGIGRSPNTTYSVGDVVYGDSNLSVALKCTTAGTTSNTELDISGRAVGENVTDGGVVWKCIDRGFEVATQTEAGAGTDNTKVMTPLRTAQEIDSKRPIKTFTSLAQLELDNNASETDIAETLPNFSILICDIGAYSQAFPNIGLTMDGTLIVEKSYSGSMVRFTFNYYQPSTGKVVFQNAVYASWATPSFSGWEKFAINGSLSMPSENSINISITPSSNGVISYKTPADGWVTFRVKGSARNRYIYNYNSYILCAATPLTMNNPTDWSAFVPVRKNEYINMELSEYESVEWCKFVYAQSEV